MMYERFWVHAPLGIGKRNTMYFTRDSCPHLELSHRKNIRIIHSTILKDNKIPLFPEFPNHNNPHTPPIPICLLRSSSQIELHEMGSSIPMVNYILPQPTSLFLILCNMVVHIFTFLILSPIEIPEYVNKIDIFKQFRIATNPCG